MKKSWLLTVMIGLALTPAQQLFAQKILTVEEAIATVLKNNYDIELLRNDSASYALDKSYAKAAFMPRINSTTGFVFNNNDQLQKFTDGTKRERNGIRSNNLVGTIQLNWTIFNGHKMVTTRAKLNEFVKLGDLAIKNQMISSVASLLVNYYNIVHQKQQLKAVEEQMSINEERVKLAEKKLSVGLGAKPELLQAKVDLNAQRSARLKQQTLIAQLKEQLNLTMNIPSTVGYEVYDSIVINNRILLQDLISGLENTSPTLLITKKNIDISQLVLKERQADRYPIVSFNSNYNYSKTDNQAVVNPFTPLYSRNNGFNYGLGVTIPILNGLNTKRLIQQSQLDIAFLKISYQSQQATINTAIAKAYKEYTMQQQALLLEEDNILLAKENVFISLERYRLGVSTYLELRETQKSLEDAYTRLLAARYNTKLSEIELMRLNGNLMQ
ncbi:MAG: TolC family protein [Chitinophagia bacterium]|nr:TolC family protein [Chitinophagia bacterium]